MGYTPLFAVNSLDVISVNLWHILFAICNLLIVYLIVKRFLFRPVQKILAQRSAEVDKLYRDAQDASNTAQENKRLYDEKLATADSTVQQMFTTAQQKAQQQADETVAQAREEAGHILTRAQAEIAREKKKAVNEIKDDISRISLSIAEKVVERELRPEDHQALMEEFVRELGDDHA